jgi:F-type H+-transporting ATPase subunit delta
MSNYRVAERYAKSLLELAIESEKLDIVKNDMVMFDNLCHESKPFLNFIKNPILHSYKKLGVFKKLFEDRIDVLSFKFIDIITRKGREDILPEISEQFLKEYRRYKKIEIIEIITPLELDESLKNEFLELSKRLVGDDKKIELKERVDDQLLGGFILRIEDKQIDDSVISKLRALRKKLIVS